MPTVSAAVADCERRLSAARIETPRLDATLLASAALGVSPDTVRLRPDADMPHEALAALMRLAERRADGREPVSRITGAREFWSLPFTLSPETLDPRPDSEALVLAVLDGAPDRAAPSRILDVGTGSGCLLLALLSELPNATGLGIDRAPGAVETAAANARRLRLDGRAQFVRGNWCDGVVEGFDWIVSNPPYIPSSDICALAPEVARHDPHGALDGGPDGLDAYRALAPQLGARLVPGGRAVLEIGPGQAAPVARILGEAGLITEAPVNDLAGRARCVVARVRGAISPRPNG